MEVVYYNRGRPNAELLQAVREFVAEAKRATKHKPRTKHVGLASRGVLNSLRTVKTVEAQW